MKIEITTNTIESEKDFRDFLHDVEVLLDNFKSWKELEIVLSAHMSVTKK